MSPKTTSDAGDEPSGAEASPGPDPAGEPAEQPDPAPGADAAVATDESPESILLQAGAKAGDPAEVAVENNGSAKELGSRTLMGIGLDALKLAMVPPAGDDAKDAPAAEAAPAASETTAQEPSEEAAVAASDDEDDDAAEDLTPTVVRPDLAAAAAAANEDTQVTSLLDEVAQALNLQASEHRDRALGKLPGMPARLGTGSRSPGPGALRPGMALTDGAEFEDPDDGPTSLTPGILSDVEVHEASDDLELTATGDPDADDFVLGLVGGAANRTPAGGTDGRTSKVPPVPGLSGPVTSQVGPPPGVRSQTPAQGLTPPASGRVRVPTLGPGTASIPPPSGRLSLPPGLISTPVVPSPQQSQIVLSAPTSAVMSEPSRRVSNLLTRRSGRSDKSGPGRLTPSGLPGAAALPTMPAVLAAQVKIATVSLAGLIAVTFAGGLLVGMLVWRGSGRTEAPRVAVEPGAIAPAPKAPAIAIIPVGAPAAAPAAVTAPPAAVVPTNAAPPPVAGTAAARPNATGEAIVTPIAAAAVPAEAPAEEVKPAPRRTVASRQPPRVRRPPSETEAEIPAAPVAAAKPTPAAVSPAPKPVAAVAPAAPPPPKTVASNAPAAKPAAPKSKPKTTWHDPFAD